MKTRIYVLLIALAMALGIGLMSPESALAADSANARCVNYTNYTITCGYLYNTGAGYYVAKSVNIAPGGAFGEPGPYEPRSIHVKNGWCMNAHFHIYGQAAGPTDQYCSPSYTSSGITAWSIYFGDGYNGADYDFVVTSYYAASGP